MIPLFDLYLADFRTPLIRELWVRQHLTPLVRDLDQRFIDMMADQVHGALKSQEPLFTHLTPLHCRVAVHTIERLIQYAFDDNEHGDQAVIDEARSMIAGYLADLSGSEAIDGH